ncbi:hypothetical protein MKZ38_002948 [Zalerion maritima]|uniref:General transcription and DNA repair factor IIH subunit TFB5 n=1 Tax=Zalerion maritima TaxID=339359 RepID=A0AAD5WSP6_9PEZI|nr:hypothetical protein MKZ38_002948 [Zalerion maritima]
MVRAIRGILITCDPPVKAIIERLHTRLQDVIIEVLDESHILIQEAKLGAVQKEIQDVIYKKEEESALQIDSDEDSDN